MSLSSGAKFGPYEIVAPLGAGGMGEVYRARDTRLGRNVALKVLPEAVARDAERLARLRREAQLLASLNHPNIAAIYGFEDSDGVHALVMELVEGPTLAECIKTGAIPFDETLPIAKQIAEALEYAHERGIIHRDLKPANIKLTNSDAVKILDFGLAKALENDPASADISSSPTVSRMATQAGIILGTAAYMSPEQAKGKSVDRRTDIWAFGCVLYEMLTGKMAFTGETVTDTLAAVIKSEPNWPQLPANTPPAIRSLLQRCLKKDPRQRLQSIGDARIATEEMLSGVPQDTSISADIATTIPARMWRRALPWAIAVVLAIVVLIGTIARFRSAAGPPVSSTIMSLNISLPEGVSVALRDAPALAFSPDGSSLVFMAEKGVGEQLYLRSMDQVEATPIAGTEDANSPFFSPDGQWIGFFADGQLKKVSIHGGQPLALADAPNQRGGTWGPDGTIIFSPAFTSGLMRVAAVGGRAEPLLIPDAKKGERSYRWPEVLPNGKGVIYTIGSATSVANYDDAAIAAYSFQTRQVHVLTHGRMAFYSSAGYLMCLRAGSLFAIPFNEDRLEATGAPVQLPQIIGGDVSSGAAYFSIAANGAMVYLPGSLNQPDGVLALVNRKGEAQLLPLPPRQYNNPRFSPDGKRLAFLIGKVTTPGDIWTYDLKAANLNRLTFEGNDLNPVWSADGAKIAFVSQRSGGSSIQVKPADGGGNEQLLLTPHATGFHLNAWSADGKTLAFTVLEGINGDLWTADLGTNAQPELFQANASGAVFSPDGKFIAYSSYQSGIFQVFVREFPAGGQWQISTDGGLYPKWSQDGRELFYWHTYTGIAKNTMAEVEIQSKQPFHASASRDLFEFPYTKYLLQTIPLVNYDVSPDGQKFVFVQRIGATQGQSAISVVVNFPAEIRALIQK